MITPRLAVTMKEKNAGEKSWGKNCPGIFTPTITHYSHKSGGTD